jgi:hypothetical protein
LITSTNFVARKTGSSELISEAGRRIELYLALLLFRG